MSKYGDAAAKYGDDIYRDYPNSVGTREILADALLGAVYQRQRGDLLNEHSRFTSEQRKKGELKRDQIMLEDAGIRILRRRPGRHDTDWRMVGFIRSMADAWEALGHRAGRAGSTNSRSRFQDFMLGWLWLLEPDRDVSDMPTSEQIRKALKQRRNN